MKYKSEISGYSFIMKDDGVIEVWSGQDMEYPESFIFTKEGSIKSEKEFQFEISDWWFKNKNS